MELITEIPNDKAKQYFLKGGSYFNSDLPPYLSFEPILQSVSSILNNSSYESLPNFESPKHFPRVNYEILTNKDGKFAWRPYELIHPAVYVSLINVICESNNWAIILKRFSDFGNGVVECCSLPVISTDDQTDTGSQITSWWQKIEQRSIKYSLEFSHILHTDVTDCYGSIYTHSIAWAIHGLEEAKLKKNDKKLLGNIIDRYIQACRYGQTNGIPQGSTLMDFLAEIVLGYVDELISKEIGFSEDFRILRYRDDYRIFTNSDDRSEEILQIISSKLRSVGMKLGVSKTISYKNVVEGAIKPDKLAGINLQDLGTTNAKTMQKQLLRLHAFGLEHPNSGALRRLVSEFYTEVFKQTEAPEDLEVQIAIATDIGFVSPATFPAIAAIIGHLISLAEVDQKEGLWIKVYQKMLRVPYNGYLEIWLQRIILPNFNKFEFNSKEPICKIVNGEDAELWSNSWIKNQNLLGALNVSKIITKSYLEIEKEIQPQEIELFKKNSANY